jgi:hypothetical protein
MSIYVAKVPRMCPERTTILEQAVCLVLAHAPVLLGALSPGLNFRIWNAQQATKLTNRAEFTWPAGCAFLVARDWCDPCFMYANGCLL